MYFIDGHLNLANERPHDSQPCVDVVLHDLLKIFICLTLLLQLLSNLLSLLHMNLPLLLTLFKHPLFKLVQLPQELVDERLLLNILRGLSLVGVKRSLVGSIKLRLCEVSVLRIPMRRARHLRIVVGLLIMSLSGSLLLSVERTVELGSIRNHYDRWLPHFLRATDHLIIVWNIGGFSRKTRKLGSFRLLSLVKVLLRNHIYWLLIPLKTLIHH